MAPGVSIGHMPDDVTDPPRPCHDYTGILAEVAPHEHFFSSDVRFLMVMTFDRITTFKLYSVYLFVQIYHGTVELSRYICCRKVKSEPSVLFTSIVRYFDRASLLVGSFVCLLS